MKKDLIKHAKRILEALHSEEQSISIFDCDIDSVPVFLHSKKEKSFLVCCTYKALHSEKEFIKKIENFISKEVYSSTHGKNTHIFWFEKKIEEEVVSKDISNSQKIFTNTSEKEKNLITHTKLPEYIDECIFKNLEAKHDPDYKKFSNNLELTKESLLTYLGTYFPRSYAESFCILTNLLSNNIILRVLQKKDTLNILSIGCGTGGDLFGLLSLISKKLPNIKQVNIKAIDGNSDALSILEKILHDIHKNFLFKVNLKSYKQKFEKINNIHFLDNIKDPFDFILSFKMLGELVQMSSEYKTVYYDFCRLFLPHLAATGICILLDVTTRVESSCYLPKLLNKQVCEALCDMDLYRTLLPLPCNIYERNCEENNCFSQKIFTVSHSQKDKDKSKVCYRVIIHDSFSNDIIIAKHNVKYIIGPDIEQVNEGLHTPNICSCSKIYNEECDGYYLKE